MSLKFCHAKHNILLHVDRTPESDSTQPKNDKISENSDASGSEVSAVHSASSSVSNVLLPTVCVGVYDKDKNKHTVRVLLDSGAQSSFMTEELCNRLKIHKEKVSFVVNGISDSQMNVADRTEVNIFSSSNNFDINLTCFVLPKITSVLPKHKIDVSQLNIPDIIKLADPCFSEPQKIDMLIGSDVFWNIVSTEQISLGHNLPVLQNTKFGWIISGPLGFSSKNSIVCNFVDLILEFNPADLVSRGIKPSDIEGTNLWWYGPEFLKLDESNWPENIGQYKKELPDVKKCVQITCYK
nr:unnamed protein product [Callosobruchus chinensis]